MRERGLPKSLMQLVHASHSFGSDEALLSGILLDARRNTTRGDITGALIARTDLFLQLLEQPQDEVNAYLGRIRRDDRHVEVTPLVRRQAADRLFPGWAMLDDPAQSWVWSMAAVHGGAVERATETDVMGFFQHLADMRLAPPREA
mgnify:CR=1 FL=1